MSLPHPVESSPAQAPAGKRPAAAPRARRTASGQADALAAVRAPFLAAVARDTPGSDLARYTEVLDELLAWCAAHPDRVEVSAEPSASGVVAFAPVARASGPRWSIRPVRGDAPMVEIIPTTGPQQEAQRERVRALFNAHSRAVLGPDARLRIGFGALKNPAARAALIALLDELTDPAS